MTKSTNNLHTFILLDRSGSMASKWEEVLSSLNSYVKELKKTTKKSKITVAVFDSDSSTDGVDFNVVRDSISLSKFKNLTEDEIAPRGLTPLFDSVSRIVNLAEKENSDKTVIVIMTDGAENSSREVNKEAAKGMLDRCRSRSWQVVFLGADFDNYAQASSLGNSFGATIPVKKGNMTQTVRKLTEYTTSYASTGSHINFTDKDKLDAQK